MSETIDQTGQPVPPNGAAAAQPMPPVQPPQPMPAPPIDRQALVDAVELLRQQFGADVVVTLVSIKGELQLISGGMPDLVCTMLANGLAMMLQQTFQQHAQRQAALVQQLLETQKRFMALKRGQADGQPAAPVIPQAPAAAAPQNEGAPAGAAEPIPAS